MIEPRLASTHRPVVVTGAQGLLGRQVVRALLDAGARHVVGLGRSARRDQWLTHEVTWCGESAPAPAPSDLLAAAHDPRYTYRSMDVAQDQALSVLLRDIEAGVLVHAAASLRGSDWDSLIHSNLRGAVGVANAAARTGTAVVLVSSGSVYGAGEGILPLDEAGPAVPVEPYGVTKRAAEDAARVITAAAGVPLVVARVFNLVGPGLQERHLPAKLASLIASSIHSGQPLRLALGPLEATRDFIDVRDAARAVARLVSGVAGVEPSGLPPTQVVNVASGQGERVQVVLDLLTKIAGVDRYDITRLPGRSGDIPQAVADVSRLRSGGFERSYTLSQSLSDMLDYYRWVGTMREPKGIVPCG